MADDHAARVKAEFERLHQRSTGAVRTVQHSPAEMQQRMERLAAELRTPMPKLIHRQARKSASPGPDQSRARRGGRSSVRGRAGRGGRAQAAKRRGGRAKVTAAGAGSSSDSSDTDDTGTSRPHPSEAGRAGSTSKRSSPNVERCACCGEALERRAIGGCCSADCWRTMRQTSPKPRPEVTPKGSGKPSKRSSVQTLDGRKQKKARSNAGTLRTKKAGQRLADATTHRVPTSAEEAASPKSAKQHNITSIEDASPPRIQPVKVRAKWLDLPLGLLQWGSTDQLHCYKRSGEWIVYADSPNLVSPVRVSGPAAQRWLRTAATQGAVTQIGTIERRIAAATRLGRHQFDGSLPFLPRTVRRRLRSMAVKSPKQSRIAQQSKAQRHADRLAAAGTKQTNALYPRKTVSAPAPNSLHRLPVRPTSLVVVDEAAKQRAEHQHQHQQQQQAAVKEAVDRAPPSKLLKSTQDRNLDVPGMLASNTAMDTRDGPPFNKRDISRDSLPEQPPPRSALWQRSTSSSTSKRNMEAHHQQPGHVPVSSTGGARGWLDNRRPQATNPAAAAAAAAMAPAGSQAQIAHMSVTAGQASSRSLPAPTVPTVVAPAGTISCQPASTSTSEVVAESSSDFGDTLDGGLQLSSGGVGLTSVVALIAPPANAGGGCRTPSVQQGTEVPQTGTGARPAGAIHWNASGDDGPLRHVLPAPSREVQ